jgi:uncharacterized membrane protein YfcA
MTIITDPWFYVIAFPAVIMLGLSKGGFSGIGMVSTPLLALTMPPLQAAAILLPIIILQDAMSVWVYRREWDGWNLKVMLPGALVGVVAAWAFAAYVSDALILLSVGLIGLALVAYAWLRPTPPKTEGRPNVAYGGFCGGLAAFTSTLIQIGAPPYYVFVLPQRLEKMVYVATTIWFFAIVNLMKVIPYFALGQFSTSGFATSVVLFPLAIASNLLGVWLVRITPNELFYRITYGIVFLLSLELTRRGVTGLIWPHQA